MITFYGLQKNGVYELKPKHFKTTHTAFKDKMGLIMFYADWCPHCSSDETVGFWTELSQELKGLMPIGAFNCNNHKKTATELGISGFPTIMFVNYDGNMEQYEGGRDMDSIMGFICKKANKVLGKKCDKYM